MNGQAVSRAVTSDPRPGNKIKVMEYWLENTQKKKKWKNFSGRYCDGSGKRLNTFILSWKADGRSCGMTWSNRFSLLYGSHKNSFQWVTTESDSESKKWVINLKKKVSLWKGNRYRQRAGGNNNMAWHDKQSDQLMTCKQSLRRKRGK